MKKISYRPDTWNADSGQVNQDRSTNPVQQPQQTQPQQASPTIKQMQDGKWMVSKPTGKPGEWMRQIWDKTKKTMEREWTVSAKKKDYHSIIKSQVKHLANSGGPAFEHMMTNNIMDKTRKEKGFGVDTEASTEEKEVMDRNKVKEIIEKKKSYRDTLSKADYKDVVKRVVAGEVSGSKSIKDRVYYSEKEDTDLTLREIFNTASLTDEDIYTIVGAENGDTVKTASSTYKRIA